MTIALDIGQETGPVSDADIERFLAEVLEAAGPQGLSDSDVRSAYDRFVDLHVSAAMVELWNRRETTWRWDVALGDLALVTR